jgi:hypothetical protein
MKKIEHSQLKKFVGRWITRGLIGITDDSPEMTVQGTDTYEWLPGEFFLLHRVDVLMGGEKNQTVEIIGHDNTENACLMRYYDNTGNSGVMTATCHDGVWNFTGENLRFTGGFKRNDMEFSGVWEKSVDGHRWTHFMEIRLSRVV